MKIITGISSLLVLSLSMLTYAGYAQAANVLIDDFSTDQTEDVKKAPEAIGEWRAFYSNAPVGLGEVANGTYIAINKEGDPTQFAGLSYYGADSSSGPTVLNLQNIDLTDGGENKGIYVKVVEVRGVVLFGVGIYSETSPGSGQYIIANMSIEIDAPGWYPLPFSQLASTHPEEDAEASVNFLSLQVTLDPDEFIVLDEVATYTSLDMLNDSFESPTQSQ